MILVPVLYWITSAYCVAGDTTPEKLTVVAGVTDIQAWKDGRSDTALVFEVEKITRHPDYDGWCF